jgi:hypothetical protein
MINTRLLHKINNKVYVVDDRVYLDTIIKLYPKYADKAIENYLKHFDKKRRK